MLVTKDLQIPIINSRCGELLDLPADFVEHPPRFDQIVEFQPQMGELRDAAISPAPTAIADAGPGTASGQFAISERKMPNGTVIEVRSARLPDGSFVQTFTDITKRCEAEAHVARLASEDPLTGLPNRRVFRSTLDQLSATTSLRRGRRLEGTGIRRPVPRSRSFQGRQRHARPSRRRPASAGSRKSIEAGAADQRRACPARRRRVRGRGDLGRIAPALEAWRIRSPRRSVRPTRSTATEFVPASASASPSGRTTATMPTISSWLPIWRSMRSRRGREAHIGSIKNP